MSTIYIAGFMGTGKTAVGRALAKRLRVSFRDSDAEIERRARMSVAQIFAKQGEPRFRALEREVIVALSRRSGVVSLGGGALLDSGTERLAHPRVALTCSEPTLWRRLEPESAKRPLLAGGRPALRALLKRRRGLYKGDLTVSTTRRSPEQAARLIAARLKKRGLA